MKSLLLLIVPVVLGITIAYWSHAKGNASGSGATDTDFPRDVEYTKLDGVKKAISKVVRTTGQGGKIAMLFDEDLKKNDVARFILLIRETGRYRAAEAIFREAGGGEAGWDAVEKFLPGSDTDPRFHGELALALVKAELDLTVESIINWEER